MRKLCEQRAKKFSSEKYFEKLKNEILLSKNKNKKQWEY